MKFLIEWESKPEDRQTLLKILKEYKQPEDVKTIFPIHSCVGSGRGVAIAETDSAEALHKSLSFFLNHINYVVTPIIPIKLS